MFIKIQNSFNPTIIALGETESGKNPDTESRVRVPLKGQCPEIEFFCGA